MKPLMLAFAALLAVVSLSVLGGLVPAQPAAGLAPAKNESTLSISGTAKVYRAPDYVDIVLGVQVHEKTASEANDRATRLMSAVVAAVKGLNLPDQSLQTGSVDLSPRYEDRRNNEEIPKIIGYAAAITLRVRTGDVTGVSKVIDTGLTAGANRVDSVQFGIKEAIEAREEAIRLATKAAKRKAAVLAESLDLKLGRVIHASVNSQQSGFWGVNRYSMNMAQVSGSQGGGAAEGEESVLPGKIEVWAETTVEYGVEAAK